MATTSRLLSFIFTSFKTPLLNLACTVTSRVSLNNIVHNYPACWGVTQITCVNGYFSMTPPLYAALLDVSEYVLLMHKQVCSSVAVSHEQINDHTLSFDTAADGPPRLLALRRCAGP